MNNLTNPKKETNGFKAKHLIKTFNKTQNRKKRDHSTGLPTVSTIIHGFPMPNSSHRLDLTDCVNPVSHPTTSSIPGLFSLHVLTHFAATNPRWFLTLTSTGGPIIGS